MRRRAMMIGFGVCSGAIFLTAASLAGDRDRHFAGSFCMPVDPETGLVSMTAAGEDERVDRVCPVPFDLDSTLPRGNVRASFLRMVYSDQNSRTESIGDLWCDVEINSESGGFVASAKRYACSQFGGCLNGTTGTYEGSLIFEIEDYNLANGWINNLHFLCSVPGERDGKVSTLRMYQADLGYQ